MPCLSDTTAAIAIIENGLLDPLECWGQPLVLTTHVVGEIKSGRKAVQDGLNRGQLASIEASDVIMARILGADLDFQMGEGEASVIAAAAACDPADVTLLIDEGDTWAALKRMAVQNPKIRQWRVICLAQFLQELEEMGCIASASEAMEAVIASNVYAWSTRVCNDYTDWCAHNDRTPLPC